MAAAACGGTTPTGGTAPSGAPADMSALAPAKDVAPAATLTWWHAMSGVNGDALNKIVAGFNSSQSKIKVEAVFQGTYDDLLAKLNTAIASNAAPALVQVYDIGQRYMYDSGQVVPMQAFIDRDKFNTSDFEPAVINYYKYQDKLQSMPFNAQKTAMYIESIARLRGHITTIAGKFELGAGLYPRPDSKPATGGNIIGGASLYIMKSRPPAEQQAAWEFVKYAMTPAVQAQWQSDTGYYPIVKAAYDQGPSKDWSTKYPQFLTAITEIRDSPQNRTTNGAVLGVMPQARQRTQKMIESVLLGQATTQAALDAAVEDMNTQIDKYNKANP